MWAGKTQKTLDSGASELFSHEPPCAWSQWPTSWWAQPQRALSGRFIYFPQLKGSDTHFYIDADKILLGSVTPYHLCLKVGCLSCPGYISVAAWKFILCRILHRARANPGSPPWLPALVLSPTFVTWLLETPRVPTWPPTLSQAVFSQYDMDPSMCHIKITTN